MVVAAVLYMVRMDYGTFDMPMSTAMISAFVGVYGFVMLMALLSIAVSICYYICIFKIFESTVPERAVSYLLISLLVPFGYPICLMCCRKKGYSKEEPQVMPIVEEDNLNTENDFDTEEQ